MINQSNDDFDEDKISNTEMISITPTNATSASAIMIEA